MDVRNKTCCFTGHRLEKLPWQDNENDPRCVDLKDRISAAAESLYQSGIRHYICGMATGCDTYFCEAAIELREAHEDVTIEAAIPWAGQSHKWSDPLRRRYDRLVEDCDFYTLVQESYTPECLMKRNRYMIDHSSILIAAYSGKQGGTMSTMLYALRQGLELIELPI